MASDKVVKLIEDVKALTVLELAELVKALEEEFGVSAAAPMAVAMAPAASEEDAPKQEEQTEFNVVLTEIGTNKIPVIKVVRDATGLGLKEAKELVDKAPSTIKEALSKEDAEALAKKFEEVGAKAELK